MAPRPLVSRRARAAAALALLVLGPAGLSGCGAPAAPEPSPAPAVIRTTPPPWDVPADGTSYITAAGMEPQPLDLITNQHVITLSISIDGDPAPLAAQIGVDRQRAVQAPVHTHGADGKVWLEGRDTDQVTLGQFFAVWGVRFTDRCLGAVCGAVLVTTQPALDVTDPVGLKLAQVQDIAVTVVSKPAR